VSGLDELTREELQALVVKLYETVRLQQAEIAELRATVERQAKRITELEEEVARLRGGGSSSPLSIKPSVAKKEKGPRKKRKHSFARRALAPARVICHAVESCPDCGRALSGGTPKWRHQVVEIPKVTVDVTDHIFVERYCGVCKKRHTPDPAVVLSGVVLGKKSVGIGLMSMIGYLKTVCRVPIGQIRKLICALWGLSISAGEIAEILHDVAELGESAYEDLLDGSGFSCRACRRDWLAGGRRKRLYSGCLRRGWRTSSASCSPSWPITRCLQRTMLLSGQ